MARIELDTVRRYRGKREYNMMQRARCEGLEVVGNGFIVREICKLLRGAGKPLEEPIEVYRGVTSCFVVMPLQRWLKRA
jgi:hypothetical protein